MLNGRTQPMNNERRILRYLAGDDDEDLDLRTPAMIKAMDALIDACYVELHRIGKVRCVITSKGKRHVTSKRR